jgi:hypothetical protein
MAAPQSSRIVEAPCDASDVVEEFEGGGGSRVVECSGADEESEVGVELFGRAVVDAVVVKPVAPYRPAPSARFAGTDDAGRIT